MTVSFQPPAFVDRDLQMPTDVHDSLNADLTFENTIPWLLGNTAGLSPEAPALLGVGRGPLTFHDLALGVERTVITLRSLGIGPADRVAIVLPNGPEMCACFLSVASAAASAPLNPAYSAAEFEFFLSDLKPAALIVGAEDDSAAVSVAQKMGIPVVRLIAARAKGAWFRLETAGSLKQVDNARPVRPDDVALLLHTSGSTARPKLVPLTHANLCHSARNIKASLDLTAGDRCLNVMPLFHIHGLAGAVLSSMTAGASVVCTPGFHAAEFFDWLDEFQPTWFTAVPTMHQAILSRAPQKLQGRFTASLRMIRSCSSALPPKVMANLEEAFGVPVVEAYGMTEASHQMAINPLPPLVRKPGSVGLPTGCEVAVWREDGSTALSGVAGDIVIRGAGITHGYADNPEANKSSFTGGWFRTGDQGYLDSEGYLFLTGRTKEIINRGGEKISPREIDEVLLAHPAVAQAMAFALPDTRLGEDVGALVVLRDTATDPAKLEIAIREFAAEKLASFKVPRRILFAKELPKGPTGKPQRIGLAKRLGLDQPVEPASGQAADHVPAETEIERRMAEIWKRVLRIERVGLDDDFLHVGGDSILAAQLIVRIREEFGLEVPVFEILDGCTVRKLAESVNSMPATNAATESVIPRVSRDRTLPVSFAQRRMWFLAQFEEEAASYVLPVGLRLRGPLSVEALHSSLQRVVDRHEVLRTTYPSKDGVPVQSIAPSVRFPMPVLNFEACPPSEREARIEELAREEVRSPFDLSRDLPLRALLVKFGQDEHVLMVLFHHIASDGWSKSVFFRELTENYTKFAGGSEPASKDLAIQYADYALWQSRTTAGEASEKAIAYWKQRLAGVPPLLELPTDHPRPERRTFHGAIERRTLPQNLAQTLRSLGKSEGSTLFMVLLAAFQSLLSRYSGQTDICVGTPIANRGSQETENLIGLFMNMLAMRTDLAGEPTFRQLLARVREIALGAYEYQSLPFERLVEVIALERSLSHTPLFQVVFQLRNFPEIAASMDRVNISTLELDPGTAQLDLALEIHETGDGLACALSYNVDLFNAATARNLLGHYETLLTAVAQNPDQAVSELPLLNEAQRQRLLVEWNGPASEYPTDPAYRLFEKHASLSPNAIAAAYEGRAWTYAELNRNADRIASHLRGNGVTYGAVVAICVERSVEMLAALLGIWKAGAAYVPLDPSYPRERLAFILQDARPALLLTEKRLRNTIPASDARVVLLQDCLRTDVEASPDRNPEAAPDGLAYILYTSGSTGEPKGVAIRHRSLTNLLVAMSREIEARPGDTLLALTTISFDISILELFLPLVTGARVAIARSDVAADGRELSKAIAKARPTILQATPATWQLLQEAGWTGAENLKIVCGGEALPKPLGSWLAKQGRVWNAYGPTETTIWSTVCRISADRQEIPIGRPLANTQLYVLDSHRELVPEGVPGELYISGDGVAAGYWHRPELTAERFLENPFAEQPGSRMYRTGDLVRYLPDGNLEFLRRIDQQVKLRGFRIELGEIESVLRRHPSVKAAAASVIEDPAGGKRLAAYHVRRGNLPAPESELRDLLRKSLPAYMLPSVFVALDELPLTPNGKVDRKALPSPAPAIPARRESTGSDMIETTLTQIWEDVLRRRPIGPADNFFDLGGHSLLGARLLARVKNTFGEQLPLASFFEAATVGEMAELLRRRQARIPPSHIIPIQSCGSRIPIFLLGPSPLFRPLILRLSEDQPVFGISSVDVATMQLPFRLEDIAARHIEALREFQPHGPYALAGWCADGVLAYEMARQLAAAGEKVPLLLLFDSFNPVMQRKRAEIRADKLSFHLANLARIDVAGVPGYCVARLRSLAAKIKKASWRAVYKAGVLADRRVNRQLRDMKQVISLAVSEYIPQPYQQRVTLVRPGLRPVGHRADCAFGWRTIVPNLEVVDVVGDHADMFRAPHVDLMSTSLERTLVEVNSPGEHGSTTPDAPLQEARFEVDPGEVRKQPASRREARIRTAIVISLVVVLFYLLPTLIEIGLASRLAPLAVYMVFGDLWGCAAIATVNRRAGIALYFALICLDLLLVRGGMIRLSTLPWITDLAPTAVIALFTGTRTGSITGFSRRTAS